MFIRALLLIAALLLSTAHAQSILFAYGPEEGDSSLPPNDDDFSEEQILPIYFRFFGQFYNRLYVSTNGIISFNSGVDDFTPDPFPVADYPIMAAFWGDVDTRTVGDVFYRLIENGTILDNITLAIQDAVSRRFTASYAYIATWYDVPKFPTPTNADRSTFQAVITTDDSNNTFVIYNYVELTWTPGQVGFDAGDDTHYYAHEWSRSTDILRMPDHSNVGVTGRWIFKVDGASIEQPEIIETTIAETTERDTTQAAEETTRETSPGETTVLETTTSEIVTSKITTPEITTPEITTPGMPTLAITTSEATTIIQTTTNEEYTTTAQNIHLAEPVLGDEIVDDTTRLDSTFLPTTNDEVEISTQMDQSTPETTTVLRNRRTTEKVKLPLVKEGYNYALIIAIAVLLVICAVTIFICCIKHKEEKDKSEPTKPIGSVYDVEMVERPYVPNSVPPNATNTYY